MKMLTSQQHFRNGKITLASFWTGHMHDCTCFWIWLTAVLLLFSRCYGRRALQCFKFWILGLHFFSFFQDLFEADTVIWLKLLDKNRMQRKYLDRIRCKFQRFGHWSFAKIWKLGVLIGVTLVNDKSAALFLYLLKCQVV